ncbi:MAG: endolytic transglycosylase MltG [Candidatus Nanosynbacter sp.]|nr:endolytic transglycosylase MltG [Candidatus Nanosynbacter sp.]
MTDFRRQPGRGFQVGNPNPPMSPPPAERITPRSGRSAASVGSSGRSASPYIRRSEPHRPIVGQQPQSTQSIQPQPAPSPAQQQAYDPYARVSRPQPQPAPQPQPYRSTPTPSRDTYAVPVQQPVPQSQPQPAATPVDDFADDALPSGLDDDSFYGFDDDDQPPQPTPGPQRGSLLGNDSVSPLFADDAPKGRTIGSQKKSPRYNTGRPHRGRRRWLWWLSGVGLLILLIIVAGYWWYHQNLQPVDRTDTTAKAITIDDGATLKTVAATLKEQGLIRDTRAFDIYTRLSGSRNQLHAGVCQFSPSQSLPEIATKLSQGCHDNRVVTFLPGGTVVDSRYKPQGQDATTALKRAGYSEESIKAALAKTYNSPLFADKPAGTSLEGYIFGDTYSVPANQGPEAALKAAFAHMYEQIQSNGLVDKFAAQKLNLYQAITLASIIQREMGCGGASQDCYQIQRQIAQVFYKRLRENKVLGSDVTFIYGADVAGVSPNVNLDSPYNTRIKPGLPPGPIATPGLGALKAVADPAPGNYEFFLAGDDGNVYFANTEAEHQANIKQHCKKLCSEL